MTTTMTLAFTHTSKLAAKEPMWGAVDRTALPRLAFARMGEPDKKSTWGFPHHWVQGGGEKDADGLYTSGTLYLHKGGLQAAWNAAMGGRSGQKAEPSIIAHLRKHFTDLGIKKAEIEAATAAAGIMIDLDLLDQELLLAGLLTEHDLQPLSLEQRLAAMIR